MKSKDINFINYTPKKKANVRNFITVIILLNIFLIINFSVLVSGICVNCINLKSGEYESVTGDVLEATYFSDTSSSLRIKYNYLHKMNESRVISNKYYKEGAKVELLINKNDKTDISVISLESTYKTMKWFIITVIILDILLLIITIARVRKKDIYRNKIMKYIEIKNINSVMINKNKEDKTMEHFPNAYKKNKINSIELNEKSKKKYAYIMCSVIILISTTKIFLGLYNNYTVKNSPSWDIISGKVSEIKDTSISLSAYEPENFKYTFDYYYKGVKQKISLKSLDVLKDGDMVDLAIKNGDISTVRKAEEKLDIKNYVIVIVICFILIYLAYEYKEKSTT